MVGSPGTQLRRSSLEYRFKGGMDLDSSLPFWGAVHLHFDRSGQIRIQKYEAFLGWYRLLNFRKTNNNINE